EAHFPTKRDDEYRRAVAHNNFGYVLFKSKQKDLKSALWHLDTAAGFLERLRKDFPKFRIYQEQLGVTYQNLSVARVIHQQSLEAEQYADKWLSLQKALVDHNPNVAKYQSELGKAYGHKSYFLY